MNPEHKKLIDFRSGPDFPEWAKDGVTVRTSVHLSWQDRLKVLVGWPLEVDTFTATEAAVGRTETRACVHIFNPRPSRPLGNVAAEAKP